MTIAVSTFLVAAAPLRASTLSDPGGLHEPAAGALLAFAESVLGVGLVLPGEAAVTTLAATTATTQLPVLLLFVTVGAVLGDHLNYSLGRLLGQRLAQTWVVRRIGDTGSVVST